MLNSTAVAAPQTALISRLGELTWLKQLLIVLGGATFTAICAQIRIPLEPVPITLQTLGVMLTGLALGGRLGLTSQVAYISGGLGGLPIFAEGKSGLAIMAGPTGGYLVGFVVAAFILGELSARGWDRSRPKLIAACVLSTLSILGLGFVWLTRFVPNLHVAWAVGVAPFLLGDVIKTAVVVMLVPPAAKAVARL